VTLLDAGAREVGHLLVAADSSPAHSAQSAMPRRCIGALWITVGVVLLEVFPGETFALARRPHHPNENSLAYLYRSSVWRTAAVWRGSNAYFPFRGFN
jgi:hypothetical protein